MTRYLGNLAVEPTRGIAFRCEACDVEWTGCAAAADCPECGAGQEYWRSHGIGCDGAEHGQGIDGEVSR